MQQPATHEPRRRMKARSTLKVPAGSDFELEFQLTKSWSGEITCARTAGQSLRAERERLIRENAELIVTIYEKLGHDAICLHHLDEAGLCATAREIRRLVGDKYLLLVHGDGTFAIPDGSHMLDFAYRMVDEPEALHDQARAMMTSAIERNKRMLAGGLDGFILCSDYCFNQGPFLSPTQFAAFITPYLARIIASIRAEGGSHQHTQTCRSWITPGRTPAFPDPMAASIAGQTSGRQPGRPGRQRALRRLANRDRRRCNRIRPLRHDLRQAGRRLYFLHQQHPFQGHAPRTVPAGFRCLSAESGLHRPGTAGKRLVQGLTAIST